MFVCAINEIAQRPQFEVVIIIINSMCFLFFFLFNKAFLNTVCVCYK